MSDMAIDSICALSTPNGRAALGVIRISGPKTSTILEESFGKVPEARVASFGVLKDLGGRPLDEVVVTYFPGPNSYTGEDLAEISCHGNPSVVAEIMSYIVSRETRIAEPGEFTRRALANGKLSLDQVESLDMILNSPSSKGARLAVRAKLSGLAGPVEEFSEDLKLLLSDLQSQLDFSDEEAGDFDKARVTESIDSLVAKLKSWLGAFRANRSFFEKWTVAIVGPTNSGKSTLFNTLMGSEC